MRDVIVVGGGPAGLYCAHRLAQAGWDVAVFEEHASTGVPVHCTGVFAADGFDEFGLTRDAVLNTLSTVRFFAPSGATVGYRTPEVEALVIDRQLFDRQLHLLAASSGVAVVAGARVTDVAVTARGVEVTQADGTTVRSRAAVLACGANYVLQRRLGLGMASAFLQSAQIELPARGEDEVEVHFGRDTAPGGFAWAVPVRRGAQTLARVGLMCEVRPLQYFQRFADRIAERWGLPKLTQPLRDVRLKMLPLAPLRRTYADRVLAVGDAAGLVKATTGGGIYYSLTSGRLAADVLGNALRTDALGSFELSEYQRRWRDRLGAELRAQLSLRRLAQRLTDGEIDELFELARTDGIMPIVRRTARFNQHRDLILSLLRHPPARRIFFRQFTNWRQTAAL